MANVLTLKQAIEGVPEASWTDDKGELWTSKEIITQWTPDQLSQPVTWAEGLMGESQLRSVGANGHPGSTLLTMEPPTGFEVPSEPPVAPTE